MGGLVTGLGSLLGLGSGAAAGTATAFAPSAVGIGAGLGGGLGMGAGATGVSSALGGGFAATAPFASTLTLKNLAPTIMGIGGALSENPGAMKSFMDLGTAVQGAAKADWQDPFKNAAAGIKAGTTLREIMGGGGDEEKQPPLPEQKPPEPPKQPEQPAQPYPVPAAQSGGYTPTALTLSQMLANRR